MKTMAFRSLAAFGVACTLALVPLFAQSPSGTVASHVAAARAAAGQDHIGLFDRLCQPEPARPVAATPPTSSAPPAPPARPAPTGPPAKSTWKPTPSRCSTTVAAAWGGTAFNFPHSKERFQTYVDSARRFSEIVAKRAPLPQGGGGMRDCRDDAVAVVNQRESQR